MMRTRAFMMETKMVNTVHAAIACVRECAEECCRYVEFFNVYVSGCADYSMYCVAQLQYLCV